MSTFLDSPARVSLCGLWTCYISISQEIIRKNRFGDLLIDLWNLILWGCSSVLTRPLDGSDIWYIYISTIYPHTSHTIYVLSIYIHINTHTYTWGHMHTCSHVLMHTHSWTCTALLLSNSNALHRNSDIAFLHLVKNLYVFWDHVRHYFLHDTILVIFYGIIWFSFLALIIH